MNALIFAAGLGSRLAHLTKNTPKALVEVEGKPMLLHAIEKLVSVGVERIVINVHHHADMIEDYVSKLNLGVELIISDERGLLLETGGALIKAASLFIKDKPIILYNADVLTGVNLRNMIDYHFQNKGIATLMVKKRKTSRYFLFDKNSRLVGWENISNQERIITRAVDEIESYAFSGIHIVNPEIISLLGSERKFSIVKGYLDISSHHAIYGWKDWDSYWFDIGTPEKLNIVNEYFSNNNNC